MSDTPSLEDRLKAMIVERLFLKIEPSEIGVDDVLMDTLGVDSVQIFEIVVGLEEEFGVVFSEEEFDIELFKSVHSIADAVRKKQAQ
ncbi:MAG: acyl carrier protein [Planctomycetes bacterium]|nr:acyl carrier protein [Planctomycetota bacterium]